MDKNNYVSPRHLSVHTHVEVFGVGAEAVNIFPKLGVGVVGQLFACSQPLGPYLGILVQLFVEMR